MNVCLIMNAPNTVPHSVCIYIFYLARGNKDIVTNRLTDSVHSVCIYIFYLARGNKDIVAD